ncbi:MAG: YHS domain-containing (seleno)protein [Pseudomonadota bacterium]
MSIKKHLLTFVALLGLTGSAMAADYQHSTPAVQGYDVVSYQNAKRPVRGNGHFVSVHNGATYLFSSSDNKKAFDRNPGKYTPAYNGYCAFGVSVGKKFVGDPEVWKVVNGKLYLNLDTNIQADWIKDIPGRIKSADVQWKQIKDKSPAEL